MLLNWHLSGIHIYVNIFLFNIRINPLSYLIEIFPPFIVIFLPFSSLFYPPALKFLSYFYPFLLPLSLMASLNILIPKVSRLPTFVIVIAFGDYLVPSPHDP